MRKISESIKPNKILVFLKSILNKDAKLINELKKDFSLENSIKKKDIELNHINNKISRLNIKSNEIFRNHKHIVERVKTIWHMAQQNPLSTDYLKKEIEYFQKQENKLRKELMTISIKLKKLNKWQKQIESETSRLTNQLSFSN